MTATRIQVIIPADTALSEDACVNTWHFDVVPPILASLPDLKVQLIAFYNAWQSHRSVLMNWAQTRIKLYDLSQPEPRPPIVDEVLGLSATDGLGSLPSEVALCVSFQAERIAGVVQARRRGRLYLGPFTSNAHQSSTGRPDATFHTNVVNAAKAMLNNTNSTNYPWGVYSRASTPDVINDVHDGWVDNAWDTQRRRGPDPTSRTAFTIDV